MSHGVGDGTSGGLSVVLPLYNGGAFVQAAIQSIIEQQDLPENWEIIAVDDGSTDNSVEICQQLAGRYPQIRIEQHEVNRGVAAARNRGVELAKHEYLGFIDQDDRWLPDKWLVQSQVLRKSKADYVLGYQQFELQNSLKPPHWFRQEWAKQPQKAFVLGGLLIQRAGFLRVGLLQESLKFGLDDVDWFNRARESGLIEAMIEHVVLQRYVHDRNASARTKQSNPELLRLIRAKLARQT
jgi:glycosyltransferase involved in cell wall biosynthesis